MKSDREISSTEKLLDIIRGKKDSGIEITDDAIRVKPKRPSLKAFRFRPFDSKVTVGVDIGSQSLRMVKIQETAENQWKLVDYRSVPLPKASVGSFEFTGFVKSELNKFCGTPKNLKVWSLIPSSKVDVRFIKIPKVPPKQVENAVYWTVKKEVTFEDNETILDYDVQGDITEQGVQKLSVLVHTTPRSEVQSVQDLFSDAGYHLAGVTIAPFAIQNLFRTEWVPVVGDVTASLYIGRDWSRIDMYTKGNLVLTRGIKAGLNSMVEALVETYNEKIKKAPAERDALTKTDRGLTTEQAHKLLMSLNPDAPPLGREDAGHQLKEEEIFSMILPAIERLVRQVERTFANVGAERVGKIYIAGVIDGYKPLVDYIGDQLGIESGIMDVLSPDNPSIYDVNPPASVSERVAFAPAVGLALSDNTRTPNLIFTYKAKEKMVKVTRVNRVIMMGSLLFILLGTGAFYWQFHLADQKKATYESLGKELDRYNPRIDKNFILQIATKVKQEQGVTRSYSERYLGMAVISELSTLTPSHIRLLKLRTDMVPLPAANNPAVAPKKEPAKEVEKVRNVEVEGIVLGDRAKLESLLSSYVLKLQSSPLFKDTKVQKTSVESYYLNKGQSEVLRFNLTVKVI
ncbi:MAG TPA: pilus assembly protein PilM [Syntrophales bacterium]|nr:pilus assembly protein PilM [Syntrophales bacterium]HOX94834.1 pilus assembly protein PilM [Syntrophales bacterium]HPI56401.1 pilus assembly protein PilM [Syntrophales bacterium]HPN24212.1 pilus assembly protein PilM [Syntrophales bacterium]HQM28565.1 pilus assembly protein PilM [Syntrophales bacterium]